MKLLLSVLLFVGFFLLFHEMEVLRRVSEGFRRTREGMDAASRQRSLADRKNLLELQERHSVWYSLEQKLQYSGIYQLFPKMTAEWWIVWNASAGAVVWLAATVFFGWAGGLMTVLFFGLAEGYLLKKLRERNIRRTEEDLIKLLDFLGNYSAASGEIIAIFRQISRYMAEPIKSALENCCNEAATTGDTEMALRAMAEKVEHPKFKELVRNIEISIRYCADFSVLAESSRRSLREYLRVSVERKGMLREAVISLFILTLMSFVVLLTVEGLTGVSMGRMLTETWIGRAAIGVLAVIYIWFRSSMACAE